MRKSYEIVLKHYAKTHPTFFWSVLVGLLAIVAFVWFGFIGPFCVSAKSTILVIGWLGLTAFGVIFGGSTVLSIINDDKD